MAAAAAREPARAVAFQGAPGANSHRAAMDALPGCLPLPCFSFEDALDAVKDGRAGRRSSRSRIRSTAASPTSTSCCPKAGCRSWANISCRSTALMATGDGPFTGAYSHPQALGQSRHFLRARGIVPLSYADTAGAAAYVAELGDPSVAAIAPRIAAELYGLKVIEDNVEDAHDNTTRFVVLAREPLDPPDRRPGDDHLRVRGAQHPRRALQGAGRFRDQRRQHDQAGKLPARRELRRHEFFCDIVGTPGDPAVDRALEELGFFAKHVRMLGTYPLQRQRG
jgi:prephenate dehydratase